MNEDDWLPFYSAAGEMEQRNGMSRAQARKQVRQACADQLITSMKAPCDDGHRLPFEFWKRIAPKEWREREVDYDEQDAEGCEIEVMIFEPDFRSWIEQQCAPQSDRDAVIAKRLRKGLPGRDVSWKVFCDGVRKDCGTSPATRGFSNETIENITRQIMKVHS